MKDHRALPAFQHVHELVLAVHEAIAQIPQGEGSALAARMESATHSAAAAIARACAVPGEQLGSQLDEASRRLREVGYYIDIAQRLGYLPLDSAVELLERQTLTSIEVNAEVNAMMPEIGPEDRGVPVPRNGAEGNFDTADLATEVLASLSAR
jgi:four helix bundle protein